MQDKNKSNKKLIFSTSQDQNKDHLEDKGVELKLEQDKYQKGQDLDSDIISSMVENLEPKKEEESNTELMSELSSIDEFQDDLAIQTDYSKQAHKRKKIYKKLFYTVLMIIIFVFSYWITNKKIDFSSDLFSANTQVESLKTQYQSDIVFGMLQKSSMLNKEIAGLSLDYLENYEITESIFKDRSQKVKAQKRISELRQELVQKVDLLKLNLTKTRDIGIGDKSLLIESITQNQTLASQQKSELVSFLRYAPILNALNQDYSQLQDKEFLTFLLGLLEATKSVSLNNLALLYDTKFNPNRLLLDIQGAMQLISDDFQIFKRDSTIDMQSISFAPSKMTGSLQFIYELQTSKPLAELIEVENKFLSSQAFTGQKKSAFNIPELNQDDNYDPVTFQIAFKYL